MAADSMMMAAKLAYMVPWPEPRTLVIRWRWYKRRMTVRRLMKILMAREKQRYGKSKLKDIQPLTDCAGVETMTSQSVPVTCEGSGWIAKTRVGLAHTESSEKQKRSESNDDVVNSSIFVYYCTPPDLQCVVNGGMGRYNRTLTIKRSAHQSETTKAVFSGGDEVASSYALGPE
jgi:hypothetical protein